jgi:hypothetical protein
MDQGGPEDAEAVAIEHCLWAAAHGLSPGDLLATFGQEMIESEAVHWQAVVEVIARVWRSL